MKTANKPRLNISFSGGQTSAVMTKLCVDKFSKTHEIAITFANTGCEHENTLKFVNDCDMHFGWGVVWIEAVVNPEKGKGIRHRIVDYETASRHGEPMDEDFAKHGLAGPGYLHCTRDTKELPIRSYLERELGWDAGTYDTAIGIRSDEMDRISSKRKENRLVYPLAEAGWTKQDVKNECSAWPFQLELEGEHYGNCVWCWKKSLRKLLTLAKDSPDVFDFPKKMEDKYSKVITGRNDDGGKRFLFRGRRTAQDLLDMAKSLEFEPYRDANTEQMQLFQTANYDLFLDTGSSCGESCEIGADD